MPFVTRDQLVTIFGAGLIKGPANVETKQSFLSQEGAGYVEDMLNDLEVADPVEVADDANVAAVVAALKTLGLFVDPGSS